MFKVFKKKSKAGLTPSTGPGNKHKSLFSLHKRKSASSLPTDGSSVEPLGLHQSPLVYNDINSTVQISHSATKPDFRSFLADGSVGVPNGSANSVERSRSTEDIYRDHVNVSGLDEENVSVLRPVRNNNRNNNRNTWQVTTTLPTLETESTSLILEEIQKETRIRSSTSSQFLSTFRSPTQDEDEDGEKTVQCTPGALDKAKSGSSPVLLDNGIRSSTPLEDDEDQSQMDVIPVPQEFATPEDMDTQVPGTLPADTGGGYDRHYHSDQGNSDDANTHLLPPSGFSDSLDPASVEMVMYERYESSDKLYDQKCPEDCKVTPSSDFGCQGSSDNEDKLPDDDSGKHEFPEDKRSSPDRHLNPRSSTASSTATTAVYETSPSRSSSGSKPSVPNKPKHLVLNHSSTAVHGNTEDNVSQTSKPIQLSGADGTTDVSSRCSSSSNNQNTYSERTEHAGSKPVTKDRPTKTRPDPPPRRTTMSGVGHQSSLSSDTASAADGSFPSSQTACSQLPDSSLKTVINGASPDVCVKCKSRPVCDSGSQSVCDSQRGYCELCVSQSECPRAENSTSVSDGSARSDNEPGDTTNGPHVTHQHDLNVKYDKLNPLEHLLRRKLAPSSSVRSEHRMFTKVETSSRLSKDSADFDVGSISTIDESQQMLLSGSFLDDTSLSAWDNHDTNDKMPGTLTNNPLSSVKQNHFLQQRRSGLYDSDFNVQTNLNDSANILLSNSFLNDTVTPLMNINTPGSKSANETVIVQDDYTPTIVTQSDKTDQPWQVSMAMAWQTANGIPAKNSTAEDDGSTSSEGSESDCTLADHLDTDSQRPTELPGEAEVYRWQLKPVSLWDVEDVCEWFSTKGLGSLQSAVREKDLSGAQLLQTALPEIGELTTNERLRQKLLHDVNLLREPRSGTPLSMKGQHKVSASQDSKPLLTDRLSNLQWLNQQQQQTVGQYLHRLEQEQTDAQNLLAKWNGQSHPKLRFETMPIMKWTTSDVLDWLDSVGMGRFAPMFTAHAVTGNDLMSIDMTLLDSVGISSISDRELILSRLYELQPASSGTSHASRVKEMFKHPLPPPPNIESTSTNSSLEAKPTKNNSSLEAKPTKNNSSLEVKPTKNNSSEEAKAINNIKNKTSRRLFDNVTDVENPSRDYRSRSSEGSPDERNLTVWHDLTGVPASVNVVVRPEDTSHDLVQRVLDNMGTSTESPQDFSLVEVTIDTSNNKVSTHSFSGDHHPMDHLSHSAAESSERKMRFEMRKKQKQMKLKVIFDEDAEISISKNIDCSSMGTCGELLDTALQVYALDTTGGSTYTLQAVGATGDAQNTTNRKLVSFYQTNTFLLKADQDSVPEVISRSSLTPLEGARMIKSHQSSKKNTPKNRQVKVEHANISHDFDLTTVTDDLDLEQLSTLTDDLDTVSRDTGVNSTDSEPENNNNWRHLSHNIDGYKYDNINGIDNSSVLLDQTESVREKDDTIKRLQKEIEQATTERKQMKKFEQWFSELERDSSRRQEDLQHKYHQLEADLLSLRSNSQEKVPEEEVNVLEQALMVSSQQIQLVEQKEGLIQKQITESEAETGSDPEGVLRLTEQLQETDTSLLDLKQQQADIYRQLKLARKQLLKQQRTQLDAERFSTYKLLQELGHSPTVLYQTVAIDLEPHTTFMLGQGHGSHPFVKHCEEETGDLVKGDRILEVNGAAVTHLSEAELSKLLNRDSIKRQSLVVLRKTTNYELKVQEKAEEAESVREDLTMAMMEVETAQDENRDLTEALDRLRTKHKQMEQDKTADRNKIQELESKLQEITIQRDKDMMEKDTKIEQLQDKVYEREQKILRLKEEVSDLEVEMAEAKNDLEASRKQPVLRVVSRSSSIRSNQRDSGIRTLTEEDLVRTRSRDFENHAPSEGTDPGDIVIAYQDFDTVPIWEGLQPASKEEVLQALKDQVLETHQQKVYLDRLLNVVIERAPSLIQLVDEAMGVRDQNSLAMKARTEEFC